MSTEAKTGRLGASDTGGAVPSPCESAGYRAVDNLEVMELAVRYNAVLASRITQAVGGAEVVLDYGAGTGTFAKQMVKQGFNVECLEPDLHLSSVLRMSGLICHANTLDFADNEFSAVYSLNVLEHVVDDASTLREMRRLLRPQGKLVLFVPAFDFLYCSMDRKVGHLRRYTRSSLRAKVEHAGFRVTRCSYFDSLGFFATVAYRLFGNRRGDLDPRKIVFYDRWLLPVSVQGDRLLQRVIGKNVFLVAERSDGNQ